ncbi:hypothetical protein NDU88_010462 [Pleurodeles waltl]|uniref:Uncharacterized protein n=1 Tax=Pleurodeles waltl TaxID=8319 RepID=A0AAV7QYC3_PLEWA|nr:hypothetical protein NDU88_010462 [Pleurodeles waltl]
MIDVGQQTGAWLGKRLYKKEGDAQRCGENLSHVEEFLDTPANKNTDDYTRMDGENQCGSILMMMLEHLGDGAIGDWELQYMSADEYGDVDVGLNELLDYDDEKLEEDELQDDEATWVKYSNLVVSTQ